MPARDPVANFALRSSTKSMIGLSKAAMRATNRLTVEGYVAFNYGGLQ